MAKAIIGEFFCTFSQASPAPQPSMAPTSTTRQAVSGGIQTQLSQGRLFFPVDGLGVCCLVSAKATAHSLTSLCAEWMERLEALPEIGLTFIQFHSITQLGIFLSMFILYI